MASLFSFPPTGERFSTHRSDGMEWHLSSGISICRIAAVPPVLLRYISSHLAVASFSLHHSSKGSKQWSTHRSSRDRKVIRFSGEHICFGSA